MNDYKFYLNLTEEESIEYASKVVQEVKDNEKLEDVLLHLALFTNGECLKPHYPILINKKIFYPGEIYLHADEKIADELIKVIENSDGNVNHLLICLAWIGTQNVVDFFVKTSIKKPKWTEKLYVLPKEYADQAGWFIDENNQKRFLINEQVSVFSRLDLGNANEFQSKTFVEKESLCKFCKNNLTTVFETKIRLKVIPFSTCLLCSCYEPFFMKIDVENNSHWHDANKKWEHLDRFDNVIEKIKQDTLKITSEKRKPEYTISQFVAISKSQIGGYPTWVQDADYLNCPDCNQKMMYVGQIDMEDFEDYSEGIYYFHYCENCKITGTNYQQS
jgi:hypothetical protein